MSDTEQKGREGWGWPALSRKAHYFVGVESLCRKWMFSGQLDEPGSETGMTAAFESGPDDCTPCTRKLATRRKSVTS